MYCTLTILSMIEAFLERTKFIQVFALFKSCFVALFWTAFGTVYLKLLSDGSYIRDTNLKCTLIIPTFYKQLPYFRLYNQKKILIV